MNEEMNVIKAQYEAMGGNWDDVKHIPSKYPMFIEAILFIGKLKHKRTKCSD